MMRDGRMSPSPGFSGSIFTVTLSLDNICWARSRTEPFLRYWPAASECNGAKLLTKKCAFLNGTRFMCKLRRSAFKGPLKRRQDVRPDMHRAMMLLRSFMEGL